MKNIEEIKNKITEIITPVINAMGIELYDVEFSKMKSKGLLRVFIEKQDGVTIDDCERVSREIEAVLDVEDPIPFAYVLEVSSPGLDRPLKELEDFKRYSGKTARVITHEPIDNQTFFIGTIISAENNEISLLLPKDRQVIIPYKNISKARLEVEV
jgi:ribosome maturation factor RimP